MTAAADWGRDKGDERPAVLADRAWHRATAENRTNFGVRAIAALMSVTIPERVIADFAFIRTTGGGCLHAYRWNEFNRMTRSSLIHNRDVSPIPVDRASDFLPVSYGQERLWFLAQLEGGNTAYNVVLGWRLNGSLCRECLTQALDRLVARHESLRACFSVRDGQVIQRLAPDTVGFFLIQADIDALGQGGKGISDHIDAELRTPFDLERGPVIRGRLLRCDSEQHVLLVALHHIVCDGASLSILANELSELYNALRKGVGDPLQPITVQYPDYAAWSRKWHTSENLIDHTHYWRSRLSGAPLVLNLPTDRDRPDHQSFQGDSVPFQLSVALTERLSELSRKNGVTLFMTLMAGWAILLWRLTNQDDLVVGVPSANRTRPETQGLIGFFANTLAIRLDFSKDPAVKEVIAQVRDAAIEAQEYQELPFEQVLSLLKIPRNSRHLPLVQVMMERARDMVTVDFCEIDSTALNIPPISAKYDLSLLLSSVEGSVTGRMAFDAALFEQATVASLVERLSLVMSAMCENEGQTATRLWEASEGHL